MPPVLLYKKRKCEKENYEKIFFIFDNLPSINFVFKHC